MDLEQLKLVLETLQTVSHDAGNLVILWMWLKFGASAVSSVAWVAVLLTCAWFIGRAIMAASGASETESFLKDVRVRLQTGSPGMLTDSERFATISKLRMLVDEHVASQKK